MTTFSLRAPSAFQVFVVKSGTTYTSNSSGIITGIAAGDITNLLNDGCSYLAPTGSGSAIGLPMVTGRFYGVPDGSTLAAVLTVSGTLTAYPVYIPSAVTLATINAGITTGQTGGKVRAALFYDSAGYPGAIVPNTDTGDLTATATAVVTKSSLTTALAAGWYWVGYIATASSTMPSVTGATAIYGCSLNSIIGSDTAAHALTVSGQAATGLAITGQTYPVTDMTTSFPTFPASATVTLNATTPIVALGV